MKILIIDPYLTSSHQEWLKALERDLPHQINALTLPPYHWKWRMHGGSMELAQKFIESSFDPDLVLVTDMLDLNLFTAQIRRHLDRDCPLVLYFHENQLTYPVSFRDQDGAKMFDNHYAFINLSSAILADWVIFNSEFHRQDFLKAVPRYLDQFPDHRLDDLSQNLWGKSSVIYPGIDYRAIMSNKRIASNEKPIILWNHRWEYDKDPDTFFNVLEELAEEGCSFNLVVLGQCFKKMPAVFQRVRNSRLAERILHWGYLPGKNEYYQWLWKADIVISTSKQDYYGISVVEAILAGCYPLLPDRLAFPEHIPTDYHTKHLYGSKDELLDKVRGILSGWTRDRPELDYLDRHLEKYRPEKLTGLYEDLFQTLTKIRPGPS